MQNITIEVKKLLPIVKQNKANHDKIFNEAVSGYWEKAEDILKEKLAKVKKQEKIENNLGLNFPTSYENDYNRVIRMLELSAEKKVELSQNEFDCYVRNQWNWKTAFVSTNISYMKTAATSGMCLSF